MVREYTRDIKGAPGHADYKDYWIHVGDEFSDYYTALLYAIEYEKTTGIKTWVELITDDL